jgi:hypothetical protein
MCLRSAVITTLWPSVFTGTWHALVYKFHIVITGGVSSEKKDPSHVLLFNSAAHVRPRLEFKSNYDARVSLACCCSGPCRPLFSIRLLRATPMSPLRSQSVDRFRTGIVHGHRPPSDCDRFLPFSPEMLLTNCCRCRRTRCRRFGVT